ncbi:MAG: hypothetical protein NHB36_03035 [Nitrospira sp.]|nr:hypothetical protein [Nitrospira sp.]
MKLFQTGILYGGVVDLDFPARVDAGRTVCQDADGVDRCDSRDGHPPSSLPARFQAATGISGKPSSFYGQLSGSPVSAGLSELRQFFRDPQRLVVLVGNAESDQEVGKTYDPPFYSSHPIGMRLSERHRKFAAIHHVVKKSNGKWNDGGEST